MSDSTPTERFDAQGGNDGDEPKSKTLLYVLIGVGGALLIAVVILLLTLLTRPATSTSVSETPIPTVTASETPSEVPSESATPVSTPTASTPTETAAPPPPAPVPGFDSFHAQSDAGCQDGDDQKQLTFSWSSDDATKAYIGVMTTNAKIAPYESDLPPGYTYTNLYYQCGVASQIYTVTLEDGSGHLTHKTVTIKK